MVTSANQEARRNARLTAQSRTRPDNGGELMWPLTSAGADGIQPSSPRGAEHPHSIAYPAMPQTLCESEPTQKGCPGMVAEPLN